MFRFANYLKSICVAAQRAPLATLAYTAVCFVVPWAVQCIEHPGDAVRFVRLATPWPAATRLMGEGVALVALAGLGLVMLGALVALYRRGQLAVPVWPTVALVCVGIGANSGWWVYEGFFDLPGCICGLAPMALSFLCELKAMEIAFQPGASGGYGRDAMFD
jgi:hypothetical protein